MEEPVEMAIYSTSLVRVGANSYSLTAVSNNDRPSIGILDDRDELLTAEPSGGSEDLGGGLTRYFYDLDSVSGMVWRFRFTDASTGQIKYMEVGDRGDVPGDDIIVSQRSSTEIEIRRIWKERRGEEYATPRISNGRNGSAALLLYPVRSKPTWGYIVHREPKYIAYADPYLRNGWEVLLRADLSEPGKLRLLRPSMEDGLDGLYEAVPVGVLLGGGLMPTHEAQAILALSVEGAV